MYNLTDEQANLLKDILKVIGKDDELTAQFAGALGIGIEGFNPIADGAFIALGNGRVTTLSQ